AYDYISKNKEKGYRIIMLPYSVGWTEGPSDIPSLISQRERWQRVINETLWHYRYMILNPRFRSFAFITLPYFILYEVLGVFFEIGSIAIVTIAWIYRTLDLRVFLLFLVLMLLSQAVISLLSLLAFVRIQRIFKLRYTAYLIVLTFLEFFIYRWLISVAKIIGTYQWTRGVREYGQYTRQKR
ncbi:MAG: glycosyltransferase family 2 protein, partial [Candidatus Omnitrophica bacterium]|nr:glycosyltransferase family 2 protein [Candidatus Omnitrophota bacterium]